MAIRVVASQNRKLSTASPTSAWLRVHSLGVPVVVLHEGLDGRSASATAPGTLSLKSLWILSYPSFWALVLYTPRAIGATNQKNCSFGVSGNTHVRRRPQGTNTYQTVKAAYSVRVGQWLRSSEPRGHCDIYQCRNRQPALLCAC